MFEMYLYLKLQCIVKEIQIYIREMHGIENIIPYFHLNSINQEKASINNNNNNNIAIWSGMTNAVLQVSGPL